MIVMDASSRTMIHRLPGYQISIKDRQGCGIFRSIGPVDSLVGTWLYYLDDCIVRYFIDKFES